MARGKVKADCRADTRGGSWAGIPKCLIDSAAYRHLTLHARAVLIELTARMNGYNNGAIAVSQRELREAIGCRPQRITDGLAELIEHGMIDVTMASQWKARQARLYRLTFVTTKTAPATNDYLSWTPLKAKSGVTNAVTDGGLSATDAVTARPNPATDAVTARIVEWRKTVDREKSAATDAVTLISKPYPPVPPREHKGDNGPLKLNGPKSGPGNQRACEQCGDGFELGRVDRAYPRRFCSERCQRANAAKRAYHRRAHGEDAVPIAAALSANVHRLIAGGRA